jgi:hypothetical protein
MLTVNHPPANTPGYYFHGRENSTPTIFHHTSADNRGGVPPITNQKVIVALACGMDLDSQMPVRSSPFEDNQITDCRDETQGLQFVPSGYSSSNWQLLDFLSTVYMEKN